MAKTPEKINETIAELETKLKQAKTLKQKIEADRKKAQKELERTQDRDRKILIGAMILHDVKTGQISEERLLAKLGAYLTRPADRAFFDLPPLAPHDRSENDHKMTTK